MSAEDRRFRTTCGHSVTSDEQYDDDAIHMDEFVTYKLSRVSCSSSLDRVAEEDANVRAMLRESVAYSALHFMQRGASMIPSRWCNIASL